MILRPASTEDLPFILGLEQKFREMRLLGGNDLATHQRQLSNPDCLYWIVETEAGPAGFVILRDIHSKDRNIELQRIAVAQPGRGLGARSCTPSWTRCSAISARIACGSTLITT